jgi:hypothetical protein
MLARLPSHRASTGASFAVLTDRYANAGRATLIGVQAHRIPHLGPPSRHVHHFICGDLRHDFDFKIALARQLLQQRIFGFERLQTLDVIRLHRHDALSPSVDRLLADTMLLRNSGHHPPVRLTKDRRHLFVRESALASDGYG